MTEREELAKQDRKLLEDLGVILLECAKEYKMRDFVLDGNFLLTGVFITNFATKIKVKVLQPYLDQQVKEAVWISEPDRAGQWWMAPYLEWRGDYGRPTIYRVIDYGRPDKGLEVELQPAETVPVKQFLAKHYPKSLWTFIPEPGVPSKES